MLFEKDGRRDSDTEQRIHYFDGVLPSPVIHSEWTQECHMRRQGSGIVARSEESITRMTSYGFLYHGNRSFTFVQDDD